jgi:hypothetical protein
MKTKSITKVTAVTLSLFISAGLASTQTRSVETESNTTAVLVFNGDHDAKAIEVLERSIEALGGRENFEKIKSVHQVGTISIPMAGLKGTMETYVQSPDKLSLIIDIAMMGKTLQGLSDGVVWSSDAMSGPRILPNEEAKPIADQADLQLPLKFLEQYKSITFVEETEFDGQPANKLEMVDLDENESTQYYSIESGLPLGSEAQADTQMGKTNVVTYMREYTETFGIKSPSKIIQKLGPTEILITVDSIEYNQVDDSVFVMPDGVKALIEATKAKEEAAP